MLAAAAEDGAQSTLRRSSVSGPGTVPGAA